MGGQIKWETDLETGILVVDFQHKEFFRLVNDLLDSSIKGRDRAAVAKAFNFLNFYIIDHFGMEESLMMEYKYQFLMEHRGFHRYFKEELQKLEAQISGNHFEEVSTRLDYLMVGWFVNHIKVQDRKLAKFLHEEAKVNRGLSERLGQLMRKFFG
ncbi:MAG TPA: hypothetical protein DCZ94_20170 [Lentisphaeria bacterium]|nr:MAG: hypothetical protein A2X48_14815 [Lentisphaerae bacterium GWF2_49_21]HBC89263.1 hypothetical protein [Lentisphaeria bacterium]